MLPMRLLDVVWVLACCTSLHGPITFAELTERARNGSNPDMLMVNKEICTDGTCTQFGFAEYDQFIGAYRGLFHSGQSFEAIQQRSNAIRREEIMKSFETSRVDIKSTKEFLSLPGDGDPCCATEVVFYKNETMLNTNDQLRIIIKLNDIYGNLLYQLMPHGRCIGYGTCNTCIQEYGTISLLVFDTRFMPPVTFDTFRLPSYCSCKNTA